MSVIIYGNLSVVWWEYHVFWKKLIKNSAQNGCFVSNDKEENGDTCIHGTDWIDDPSKCVFKLMILEATHKKVT